MAFQAITTFKIISNIINWPDNKTTPEKDISFPAKTVKKYWHLRNIKMSKNVHIYLNNTLKKGDNLNAHFTILKVVYILFCKHSKQYLKLVEFAVISLY